MTDEHIVVNLKMEKMEVVVVAAAEKMKAVVEMVVVINCCCCFQYSFNLLNLFCMTKSNAGGPGTFFY